MRWLPRLVRLRQACAGRRWYSNAGLVSGLIRCGCAGAVRFRASPAAMAHWRRRACYCWCGIAVSTGPDPVSKMLQAWNVAVMGAYRRCTHRGY